MISFLKTVLIILLVYLGLRFLLRWLSPYLLRYLTKKVMGRFETAFNQGPAQHGTSSNDTSRKASSIPKPNPNKVVGEYVEYEEID